MHVSYTNTHTHTHTHTHKHTVLITITGSQYTENFYTHLFRAHFVRVRIGAHSKGCQARLILSGLHYVKFKSNIDFLTICLLYKQIYTCHKIKISVCHMKHFLCYVTYLIKEEDKLCLTAEQFSL